MGRQTAAERAAIELLQQFGMTSPPTPVDEIAVNLGAHLVLEPFEGDVSGLLLREENGDVVIGVNATHHPNRRRFTVAHEIGHLILHQRDQLFVDKQVRIEFRDERASLAVDSKEIDANAFAAELLMPHYLITQEADGLLGEDPDVEGDVFVSKLARLFGVSQQAMQFRLSNLGYWGPL